MGWEEACEALAKWRTAHFMHSGSVWLHVRRDPKDGLGPDIEAKCFGCGDVPYELLQAARVAA